MEGSVPLKRDIICDMGEGLGTGILVSEPSALSPEPQSHLSHMSLAHSALPPLELRMSDCKQGFCLWALSDGIWSLSYFSFSLADRIPAHFHSQMLCGHLFLALVRWAVDPRVRVRPCAPQGGAFAAEIFLQILSHHPWGRANPFCVSALPTSLVVASVNPWL